jgi:hypothetical protein
MVDDFEKFHLSQVNYFILGFFLNFCFRSGKCIPGFNQPFIKTPFQEGVKGGGIFEDGIITARIYHVASKQYTKL